MIQKNTGKFIAFEGLDGSGSSTQITLLEKSLINLGKKVVLTKEPTNNIVGGLIRGLLTNSWKTSPEGFQLLFAADRAHHLDREILPAIEAGKIVISDRYLFSTLAFGSIDIPLEWLKSINSRFVLPDLTILLKVDPEVCIERISKSSRGGFEYFEKKEMLEKTWKTYSMLAKDKKNKMVIVDGVRSVEEIATEVLKVVGDVL